MLDFVPAFGLVAIDPGAAEGRIHVEIYSHRSGAFEPVLPLHADTDGRWFRHFAAEFDRIWAVGRPVESAGSATAVLPGLFRGDPLPPGTVQGSASR
jgi:hypothetical protein